MSNSTATHIVLIHGAWHQASTYDSLRPLLHEAGFTTSAISLPSISGVGVPHQDRAQDTAAVRDELERVANNGHDIIAVFHSYGGIPGSDACAGLGKQERTAQGQKGGVIHVICLAAFMLTEGQTLGEARAPDPIGWFLNFELLPGWACVTEDNAIKAFYNGMEPEIAKLHVQRLRPQSPGPFMFPQKYAPWLHGMPATHIVAELDEATELFMTERMLKAKGWTGKVVRVKAQHCLYLTHPEAVVNAVKDAAIKA